MDVNTFTVNVEIRCLIFSATIIQLSDHVINNRTLAHKKKTW